MRTFNKTILTIALACVTAPVFAADAPAPDYTLTANVGLTSQYNMFTVVSPRQPLTPLFRAAPILPIPAASIWAPGVPISAGLRITLQMRLLVAPAIL